MADDEEEERTSSVSADHVRVEMWPIDRLRSHPENTTIFGDPEGATAFPALLASIRKHGIREPLHVKTDGTVLAGHLRLACAARAKLSELPVRVWPVFASYRDEVEFVIRSNTERRQLTPEQIAYAFKRLKELPKEEGGAKRRSGRPRSDSKSQLQVADFSKAQSRDDAAAQLQVPRNIAEACETVFTTPSVPDELKSAVNAGTVAPTTAARAIRAEMKRQSGELRTTTALTALAHSKREQSSNSEPKDHAARVAEEAKKYDQDYARLLRVYQELSSLIARRPLKSVIGPKEHHEYGTLLRDLSILAWREVESVQGNTNAGKQMSLSVIQGGKS